MCRNNAIFFIFIFLTISSLGKENHPHILVSNSEKQSIRQKIENQKWAKHIFDDMQNTVTPYVERHQSDREWILSRYLMNRVEGKRYTHAYDNGTGHYIVRYSGDAPVPTVRVSTHKRSPVTKNGSPYKMPTIEELVPYDTAAYIWALNTETNQKDFIDPQQFVSGINGKINELALKAAIIYWLEGDEKYARFAADIINQWARGAFYQEPIVGACRTGFLDIQTLGDNRYQSLILAYDFVYPFMKQQGYDLSFYQNVFEKFASTLTFRGYWNNNWYAAVSSTLVYAALSLNDPSKRDYYLQFVLERDTINGSCGHLCLASTVKNWLTHDGHWKEPGGYHNFPVSNLLKAALALEKNGYDVFQRFPELFGATHAMLKYSFPNLRVSAFGDTGRAFQSPETLEIGLSIATIYNRQELPGMIVAMNTLIERGMYDRSQSGIFGLLTSLSELPKTETDPYHWPRSGSLDFARFYLQRNSMDAEFGLMYGVQGASYNHNHCNGMAMELFGCGQVMGIDAGTGPNYEHPLHQNYYCQWAAHNTVVAGGSSSSVPFNGNAGKKNIGQIELAAMEPMPDQEAISPYFSFTDTRYFDASTQTNQLRTMAIIRTSETSGYYVDIYRSDNKVANDYVYHNIGDDFTFLNEKNNPVSMRPANYPLQGKDYPGFRFFSDVEKTDNFSGPLKGLFSAKDEAKSPVYMQVLLPAANDRTYFRAKTLPVKTAGSHYKGKQLPVFTIHTDKEAWSNPFIAIFEPYRDENQRSVKCVEKITGLCSENHTVIRISHIDGSEQIIFQGNDDVSRIANDEMEFSGHFGVASLQNGELVHLYLGEGSYISYGDISITAVEGKTSAELQILKDNKYTLRSNTKIMLNFGNRKLKNVK